MSAMTVLVWGLMMAVVLLHTSEAVSFDGEACLWTCPGGKVGKQNPEYTITSNGCGPAGLQGIADPSHLLLRCFFVFIMITLIILFLVELSFLFFLLTSLQ